MFVVNKEGYVEVNLLTTEEGLIINNYGDNDICSKMPQINFQQQLTNTDYNSLYHSWLKFYNIRSNGLKFDINDINGIKDNGLNVNLKAMRHTVG